MRKVIIQKFRKIAVILIAVVSLISLSSCSLIFGGDNDESKINGVYTNKIIEANFTVFLESTHTIGFGTVTAQSVSQGSGVVFKKNKPFNSDKTEYFLLTNNHVIYQNTERFNKFSYSVRDCYGENIDDATLVAFDPNYDLAVIKFKSENVYPALEFETQNPSNLSTVIAMGQPLGIINSVTIGKVKTYTTLVLPIDNGVVNKKISNVEFEVIKHTAPINTGSSGGVLLDGDYKIVGINYAVELVEGKGAFIAAYTVPVVSVIEFLSNYGLYIATNNQI